MNKKELIEISDKMFKTINHYVIHHDFKLDVYNISNGQIKEKLDMNNDCLVIMNNFIDYIFNKVIIQIIIMGTIKTIKVFVRDKKELLKWEIR